MKTNLLILFTLLALLFSCKANKLEETPTPQDAKPVSDVLSTDEALEQLYCFIEAMSPTTRAGGGFSRAKGISEIKVSGGSMTTRSSECDVPDTLVYVVNFENDGGFAVLGARRTVEPILALTESGSLDAEKLNAAIAKAQQRMLSKDRVSTRSNNANMPMKEIGPDIIYPLLAEAMTAPAPRIAEILIKEEAGAWVNNSTVGPLVEVKWGQGYPFNISISAGPFTGCAIVAAAQIMSRTRKPILAPGTNGQAYNWTSLLSVANYSNINIWATQAQYDTTATRTQKLHTQQLSDMMGILGDQAHFKAVYYSNRTSVAVSDIVPGLISLDVYYANAKMSDLTSSNFSSIYAMIDNSKPVYVLGQSVDGGHGWVVDGYLNSSRTVKKWWQVGYTGPIRIETKTEKRKLWHMNMGWSGKNDGYYAESIFDMTARISTDSIIDSNITNKNTHYNFTTSKKYVSY